MSALSNRYNTIKFRENGKLAQSVLDADVPKTYKSVLRGMCNRYCNDLSIDPEPSSESIRDFFIWCVDQKYENQPPDRLLFTFTKTWPNYVDLIDYVPEKRYKEVDFLTQPWVLFRPDTEMYQTIKLRYETGNPSQFYRVADTGENKGS